MKRRIFLNQSAIISLGFLGLSKCVASESSVTEAFRYGPLVKDPKSYLDLPKGFSYRIISKAGNKMDDGLLVPGMADGMASFLSPSGKVILVRNHELSPTALKYGAFGSNNESIQTLDTEKFYDAGKGESPGLGGTTTLVYDEDTGALEKEFLSLAGTNRNCAGGLTPWGSWISSEEDVSKAIGNFEKNHGYNFEVPATEEVTLHQAIPLTAMGRFNHEAVCVDPKTGIVYQTEDRHDSLFYRFIPHVKGELDQGGSLQVLCIKDTKQMDTRNWDQQQIGLGEVREVYWLDIDGVDSPEDDLRYRGYDLGAARFARGEGIWFGDNELYFACTNGGPNKLGQIFKYIPEPSTESDRDSGQLILFAESDSKNILKNCDNLTVAPFGDLVLCEDHKDAYLRGITPEGKIYTFAHNVGHKSEFAGACFSPSGKTLFVNIQGPGHTLAITGPWDSRQPIS